MKFLSKALTPMALACALTAAAGIDTASATTDCQFKVTSSSIYLLNNCTTDQTFYVPNKKTFNGQYFTITAVDPQSGPFQGAVLAAAQGATAKFINVNITSNLADICGAPGSRLVGIMFNEAQGAVDRANISMFRGAAGTSACPEGYGILVKSTVVPIPPAKPKPLKVSVQRSNLTNNQAVGILASGLVNVPISSTNVVGFGPVPQIAQQGVVFSNGAIGTFVKGSVDDHMHSPMNGEPAYGILVNLAGKSVKVDQTSIHRNDFGIRSIGAQAHTFSQNTIVDSTISSLRIEDDPSQTATYCKVTANTFAKSVGDSVVVHQSGSGQSVYKNRFFQNFFDRNKANGIVIEGGVATKVDTNTFSLTHGVYDILDQGTETYFNANVCDTANVLKAGCTNTVP